MERITLDEIMEMRKEIKSKVNERMSDKLCVMHEDNESLMRNLVSIVYQMDKEMKEYFIVLFDTFFVSKGMMEGDFEYALKKFEFEVNELHAKIVPYTHTQR